jgi:hypothetical protein
MVRQTAICSKDTHAMRLNRDLQAHAGWHIFATILDVARWLLMFQETQAAQFSIFEWGAPLFGAAGPPATPTWNGHIPFLFLKIG